MDNAIKAFYMGAAMLIAVLVICVWVYIFRSAGKLSESYEFKKSTEQVQAFNSQFEAYERETFQSNQTNSAYSFSSKGNTASDVISCANLAFDINSKCDYDMQNTVQVTINMGAGASNKYYIYPLSKQKKNNFIKGLNFDTARIRTENATQGDEEYYDFYNFLKSYNDVRIVNISSTNYNSTNETIYKYYFDVDDTGITYSEITGKVNSITFNLKETNHFDTTLWNDI